MEKDDAASAYTALSPGARAIAHRARADFPQARLLPDPKLDDLGAWWAGYASAIPRAGLADFAQRDFSAACDDARTALGEWSRHRHDAGVTDRMESALKRVEAVLPPDRTMITHAASRTLQAFGRPGDAADARGQADAARNDAADLVIDPRDGLRDASFTVMMVAAAGRQAPERADEATVRLTLAQLHVEDACERLAPRIAGARPPDLRDLGQSAAPLSEAEIRALPDGVQPTARAIGARLKALGESGGDQRLQTKALDALAEDVTSFSQHRGRGYNDGRALDAASARVARAARAALPFRDFERLAERRQAVLEDTGTRLEATQPRESAPPPAVSRRGAIADEAEFAAERAAHAPGAQGVQLHDGYRQSGRLIAVNDRFTLQDGGNHRVLEYRTADLTAAVSRAELDRARQDGDTVMIAQKRGTLQVVAVPHEQTREAEQPRQAWQRAAPQPRESAQDQPRPGKGPDIGRS